MRQCCHFSFFFQLNLIIFFRIFVSELACSIFLSQGKVYFLEYLLSKNVRELLFLKVC